MEKMDKGLEKIWDTSLQFNTHLVYHPIFHILLLLTPPPPQKKNSWKLVTSKNLFAYVQSGASAPEVVLTVTARVFSIWRQKIKWKVKQEMFYAGFVDSGPPLCRFLNLRLTMHVDQQENGTYWDGHWLMKIYLLSTVQVWNVNHIQFYSSLPVSPNSTSPL